MLHRILKGVDTVDRASTLKTSKTLRPITSITIIIPASSCFPFLVYSSINFVVQTSTGQCVGSSPIHVDSWKCRHGSLTGTSIFFKKKANSFLNGINFHLPFSSQRLAEDKNPAIANAASKTIHELKKQWEIQEGDSWRFMMNQKPVEEVDSQEDNNDADTG
jgi:hypothetical protein